MTSSLVLTADDTRRIGAAVEALLTPSADIGAWWQPAEQRLHQLFPGARALCTVPEGNRLKFVSASVDDDEVSPLREMSGAEERGYFLNADPAVTRWHHYRRTHDIELWTEESNGKLIDDLGFDFRKSIWMNEGLFAAKMFDNSGISTISGGGEMFLVLGYPRRGVRRFGDADVEVLRLLLPAFRAGHHALTTLGARQTALATTLDGIRDALLVVGADGRELHRNSALRAMLEGEPERDRLAATMLSAAHDLRALVTRSLVRGVPAPAERTVATAVARYTMRASFGVEQAWGATGTVIVSLEREDAPALSSASLVTRFGLTEREAQAAALLARRVSNAELAAALGVSPHTARHHTEKVMQKLGVHSRKELALRVNGELGMGNGRP